MHCICMSTLKELKHIMLSKDNTLIRAAISCNHSVIKPEHSNLTNTQAKVPLTLML